MTELNCPRCRQTQTLTATELGHLCSACEGCWFSFEQFSQALHLPREQLEASALQPTLNADSPDVNLDRYIRCPFCDLRMKRHIYLMDSGVVVDMCREHGFWLDDGELARLRGYLGEQSAPA